jgi:hypothetical protein
MMAVLVSMKISSTGVLRLLASKNTHSPQASPMLLEIHLPQDPNAVRLLVHE